LDEKSNPSHFSKSLFIEIEGKDELMEEPNDYLWDEYGVSIVGKLRFGS